MAVNSLAWSGNDASKVEAWQMMKTEDGRFFCWKVLYDAGQYVEHLRAAEAGGDAASLPPLTPLGKAECYGNAGDAAKFFLKGDTSNEKKEAVWKLFEGFQPLHDELHGILC